MRVAVTVWMRRLPSDRAKWFENHVVLGHVRRATPEGTELQLKLWASSQWRAVHSYVEGENPSL